LIPSAAEAMAMHARRGAAGAADAAKGFGKAEAARREERKRDRKWELEAAGVPEWAQWLSEQREAAGVKDDGVYVQAPALCTLALSQLAWHAKPKTHAEHMQSTCMRGAHPLGAYML